MTELVTIDVKNHVADVRLNRPEKMNAINQEMWKAIGDAGAELADNREIRAIVLSGNGRGFCAGLDMGSFERMGDRDANSTNEIPIAKPDELPGNHVQTAAILWKRLPAPVIGAIHGVAYGAGAQLAPRSRHPIRCPGHAHVHPRNQMGLDPGRWHHAGHCGTSFPSMSPRSSPSQAEFWTVKPPKISDS